MTSTPSGLVQALLAHRAITTSDVVDAGLQLLDDVRDRFVLSSLTIGGRPSFMIKRARYPEAIESLRQELRAYRYIRDRTGLDSIMPALIADDPRDGLLVMEWIGGAAPVNMGLPFEEAADHLGTKIGRLHACTQRSGNETGTFRRPWILSSLDRHSGWQPPELDTLLARTDHADILASGLNLGYRSWRQEALIHGDLKWEHCLSGRDQNGDTIRLIDWELATFGDPAWDVASIISDILFDSQYAHRTAMGSVQKALQRGEGDKFLQSYAQARPVDTTFPKRVALYTGARLFQTSLESASAYGVGEQSGVDTLLSMSVDIFRDLNGVTTELSRGLIR